MWKAQLLLTSVIAVSTQHFCKSGSSSQDRHPKNEDHVMATSEKYDFSDLPNITQVLYGRGRDRIQFSRAEFNCLSHETILSLPAIPVSFTTHLLTSVTNGAGVLLSTVFFTAQHRFIPKAGPSYALNKTGILWKTFYVNI